MTLTKYQESVFHNGLYEFKGLIQNKCTENNDANSCTAPDGEIILCLHGWLDNAASFIPLLSHLTDHTVIAIDLIGHGHSPHRSVDAHYHFFDWIDDVLRLINNQGWTRIHIVGHSMGGMIACALAAAFGDKIASITLLDVLGFICSDVPNTTEQLQQGLLSRQVAKNKKTTFYSSIERAVQTRMYMGCLTETSATLIVDRGIVETQQGYTWRADPRLNAISPYRLTQPQAKQLLIDIKCPVQLLYGDEGYLANGNAMMDFSDSIQELQVVKFSGKHHFHMEQAEKTAKLITELIKTHSR